MRDSRYRFEIRKKRVRSKISKVTKSRFRLSVFKSCKHLYAQIIDDNLGHTLVSCSTLNSNFDKKRYNVNIKSAKIIGSLLSYKANEQGISEVVFDKGGYKYHGIIKALADAARDKLNF